MRTAQRIARWAAIAIALLISLIALTLSLPIQLWRTGEVSLPPLILQATGSAPPPATRIWIDTDAACGAGDRTDPDDCFALLALAHALGPRIAGISTVFGNAPLDTTDAITRELVSLAASETSALPPVQRGSNVAMDQEGSSFVPAVAALRDALASGPLTIVALGPLTNVARALTEDARLRANVVSVIAVMGRRPGHIFHPTEGHGEGMGFGHGPVFRDFNFAMDPLAARSVLASEVQVIFIPYDAARMVEVTQADLMAMVRAGGAARWLAQRAQGWLRYWNQDIGHAGFYPFDLIAAIYAIDRSQLRCAQVQAWVGEDALLWRVPFTHPLALLVDQNARTGPGMASAWYCPAVEARLSGDLRRWLVQP